jgi:hypothetical protein
VTRSKLVPLALAVVAVAALGACGIGEFDASQPVPAQTIPGSPVPGPLAALFPIPLSIDLQAAIAAHDTGPIDSVTLSSLTLSITSTGGAEDWSFVTGVQVYVSSTMSGSTLPRAEIATVSSPGAVMTLTFVPDDGVNLKPYIDEGSTVDGTGSGTAPANDITYDGTATFTVHPV